jgi:hypothetical protein
VRRRSVLVALAAAAGALAVLRRRAGAGLRVDVFYEDGSMVSLEPGAPQAERMASVAREAIAAARAA